MALTDDLRAYWALEGNSNDSVASHDGTDNNVTYGSSYGKISQGANFASASSSDITVGDSDDFSFADKLFTISFWLRCGNQTNFAGVIAKYAGSNWEWGVLFDAAHHLQFQAWNSGGSAIMTAVTNTTFNDDTWRHVVAVSDGSKGYVYVNNSEDTGGGNAWTDVMTNGTSSVFIGSLTGSANFYDGELDEIGIWHRELSSAEISQLYNGGSGLTYPFSAGGGGARTTASGRSSASGRATASGRNTVTSRTSV